MTVAVPVALRHDDVVAGRVFTHPDHVATDRATMCMLFEDFQRHALESGDRIDTVVRYVPSDESWFRRVILPRPALLAGMASFTVVGFFGRQRDQIPPQVSKAIDDLGSRLVAAVPSVAGLLGYSTHLLADEKNYANLVVLDGPERIQEFRDTPPHPEAAEVVSPDYYEHVRIYRGSVRLVGAEPGEFDLSLDRVKYWDFRESPTWHAVRSFVG